MDIIIIGTAAIIILSCLYFTINTFIPEDEFIEMNKDKEE